jgi:3-deoxy-7-phosphoheptulonate synthase
MVVVMNENATEDQIQAVISKLVEMKFDVHRSTGVNQTLLGAIGDKRAIDPRNIELMEGVHEVLRITTPYKLASRSFHPENTVIKIRGVEIGGDRVVVMAGPCSVETQEQIEIIAAAVKKAGAKILRGGAFKPRTSPYSFQGLGEPGLKILRNAAEKEGLLSVSEVMEVAQVPLVAEYVDILQVGARNMQNFNLLRELGRIRKPVLLKRGLAATIEELLMAAEYIMAGGNYQVILCERGIRTFENATRNTLDISAIPVVKKLSHLPIIADPSHGTGRRDKVAPMARAAVAAGADGVIIEVHHDPDNALSDGAQSLFPEQFSALMEELRMIAQVIRRKM